MIRRTRLTHSLAWNTVEYLESRNLLSASPLIAGLAASTSSDPSPGQSSGVFLAAQLSSPGSTPTANVQFAQNTAGSSTVTCFSVEVQGAPASDTLSVTLDGVAVGQITTNAQGSGQIVISSNPQGPQLPLPTNFPTGIASGTTVGVSDTSGAVDLSGSLAAVTASTIPPGTAPSATILSAQVSAAGSTAAACFQFTQATVGSTTLTVLAVQIHGAGR